MFTEADKQRLEHCLNKEKHQVYTVVVLGKRDLENGDLDGCMWRLRVDADKFHNDDELYELIKKYFDHS